MKIINCLIFIFSLVVSFQISSAEGLDINNPHGIELGSSKKEAINLIESNNMIILENEKDSKDIRRIIFDGSLVNPEITNSDHHETRLELKAQEQYLDYFKQKVGEATSSEKMLSYELWSWDIENYKILLNSNIKNKSLKVEYVYEPVLNKKIAKELDLKRKGPRGDPAREMFVDGTYSKPKY